MTRDVTLSAASGQRAIFDGKGREVGWSNQFLKRARDVDDLEGSCALDRNRRVLAGSGSE